MTQLAVSTPYLLFDGEGVKARTQHLESELPVLQLAPLLRAKDTDARRLVEQVNGGLHLVDILPPSATTACCGQSVFLGV